VPLIAGLVLPAPVGSAFIALSLGLPGLVLQDSRRFAFFAGGRPLSAFTGDVAWSVLLDRRLSWCMPEVTIAVYQL
jgi:hypothetical protein